METQSEGARTAITFAREYIEDVRIKPAQVKYLVTEAMRGAVQVGRFHAEGGWVSRRAPLLGALSKRGRVVHVARGTTREHQSLLGLITLFSSLVFDTVATPLRQLGKVEAKWRRPRRECVYPRAP
jgi:hypothetical protein